MKGQRNDFPIVWLRGCSIKPEDISFFNDGEVLKESDLTYGPHLTEKAYQGSNGHVIVSFFVQDDTVKTIRLHGKKENLEDYKPVLEMFQCMHNGTVETSYGDGLVNAISSLSNLFNGLSNPEKYIEEEKAKGKKLSYSDDHYLKKI